MIHEKKKFSTLLVKEQENHSKLFFVFFEILIMATLCAACMHMVTFSIFPDYYTTKKACTDLTDIHFLCHAHIWSGQIKDISGVN